MKSLVLIFTLLITSQLLGAERVLHVYNWAEYLTDEVVEQFEKETGIKVKQDYFASNEELRAKLQAGAFDYDVAVPSDDAVKILIAQNLLSPLNHALLPNRKNLEERFQSPPYDPGNRHSIPYFWGTTGVAYDSDHVKTPITSWKELFSSKWKRKINLLDDYREVIGAALRAEGHSFNSKDKRALESAREFLVEHKENIRTFNSSTYKENLDAGDIWISQGFSVDIVRLSYERPNIKFVIPEEGGTLFTDNLVIPARSKRINEAHEFINFILRPDVSSKLAMALKAATPNQKAKALLPKEVRDNPSLYPPSEILKRLEYVEEAGSALETYESIWIDLKTR